MNGRIYDPLIGRFMSADPFIQFPDNLQGYNRYAYVQNNPLNLVDPSGYKISFKKLFKIAVVVAVAVATQGAVNPYMLLNGYSVAAAKFGAAVAAGAASSFVSSGGDLKATAQGAFTAALFAGASFAGGPGLEGANSVARYAAHAAAGCISAVAGGGACGSGAASAAFGKFATNNIDLGGDFANGVGATVAGGVGSVIAGGKFENGATNAAFGYLFNFLASKEANINRRGAVKDTSFSIEVDSGLEIDLRYPPALTDRVGLGKAIRRIWQFEDAREAVTCGLKTSGGGGCFGTRDLASGVREQARKLDVDVGKAVTEVIRQNPSWSLNNLSRTQFTSVLQAIDAAVPSFRSYYGSPSSIVSRFPESRN